MGHVNYFRGETRITAYRNRGAGKQWYGTSWRTYKQQHHSEMRMDERTQVRVLLVNPEWWDRVLFRVKKNSIAWHF